MKFPTIFNISEVLPRIEGKNEFRIIEKEGGYTYIDYSVALKETFDNPYAMECRGITFSTKTGRIIRRPLNKFFNKGERPDLEEMYALGKMKIFDKMDGSMICPFIVPETNELRFGTRAGITDVSLLAEKYFLQEYSKFCRVLIEDFYVTPIFEFTSPDNRIVIPYSKPALTLLTTRDINTGVYVNPINFKERCKFDFSTPETYEEEYLEKVPSLDDKEGVVVWFPHGYCYKMKSEAYVLKHRTKDRINEEKDVVALIVEDQIDDLSMLLSEEDWLRVSSFRDQVLRNIVKYAKIYEDIVDHAKYLPSRKDQAIYITKMCQGMNTSIAFRILDGIEPVSSVKTYLTNQTSSRTKIETARWLIGPSYVERKTED